MIDHSASTKTLAMIAPEIWRHAVDTFDAVRAILARIDYGVYAMTIVRLCRSFSLCLRKSGSNLRRLRRSQRLPHPQFDQLPCDFPAAVHNHSLTIMALNEASH